MVDHGSEGLIYFNLMHRLDTPVLPNAGNPFVQAIAREEDPFRRDPYFFLCFRFLPPISSLSELSPVHLDPDGGGNKPIARRCATHVPTGAHGNREGKRT